MKLKSFQRKYLRSLAHHIKPAAYIGKDGITDGLTYLIDQHLDKYELMKIKFLQFKDKKRTFSKEILKKTTSTMIGSIGNIIIIFRQNKNKTNRRIIIPNKP